MAIENENLIFERAYDNEALSSFNCGVREIDQLIHKKVDGLDDFLRDKSYDSFIVYWNRLPVAVFVYRGGLFEIEDGFLDATEIEFIAVREEYRGKGIGTKIIKKISEYSLMNNVHILKVGAFYNKRYSAVDFYKSCKFEQYSDKNENIVPMFKELATFDEL